jgi:hypothetical protein
VATIFVQRSAEIAYAPKAIELQPNRRRNLVDILPAGPEAHTKLSSISFSSMARLGAIGIIGASVTHGRVVGITFMQDISGSHAIIHAIPSGSTKGGGLAAEPVPA